MYACRSDSGAPLGTWLAHTDAVSAVDCLGGARSGQPAELLTASWDGTIKLWEWVPNPFSIPMMTTECEALPCRCCEHTTMMQSDNCHTLRVTSVWQQAGGGTPALGRARRRISAGSTAGRRCRRCVERRSQRQRLFGGCRWRRWRRVTLGHTQRQPRLAGVFPMHFVSAFDGPSLDRGFGLLCRLCLRTSVTLDACKVTYHRMLLPGMQAEASSDYIASLAPLPGESAVLAAAADGRLSLLDLRAGRRPLAVQVCLPQHHATCGQLFSCLKLTCQICIGSSWAKS